MGLGLDNRSSSPPDIAAEIARVAREYGRRGRRKSLDAVERLRRELPLEASPPAIAVVGTNGKTSTATYLARLLTASGRRSGLYVSPHLADWGERVRIDDVSSDPRELLGALAAVAELARTEADPREDLRFFDLLTLAADLIFSRAGVDVAVFEAGIGGRLDAVATLRPRLVLLTGVALDHTEILGESLGEILREKLLVAPPGAIVASIPLAAELSGVALEVAAERNLRLEWVRPDKRRPRRPTPDLPDALCRALGLAEAGSRLAEEFADRAGDAPGAGGGQVDLHLPGRFECGMRDGVPYVLDVAHNDAAWCELAAEMERRFGGERPPSVVALVSVSPSKRRRGLAAALRSLPGFEMAIVSRHTTLPAADPEEVAEELRAAGLGARVVEDSTAAATLAFELAGRSGGRVLAFGSSHLVGDVCRWLATGTAGPG